MSTAVRGVGTIILAAIVSGLVAGTVQLQLAISFNAHEEFIAIEMLFMLIVLLLAASFGVALLAGAGQRAIAGLAVALAAVLVVVVAGAEVAMTAGSPTVVTADLPIVAEIIIPGLLAVLIQWWLVRRHLRKWAT